MLLSLSIAIFVFSIIMGILYMIKIFKKSSIQPQVPRDDSNNDNGQDNGGGDGGIDYDPDLPLDLPPGVYVLPKEPVGISE